MQRQTPAASRPRVKPTLTATTLIKKSTTAPLPLTLTPERTVLKKSTTVAPTASSEKTIGSLTRQLFFSSSHSRGKPHVGFQVGRNNGGEWTYTPLRNMGYDFPNLGSDNKGSASRPPTPSTSRPMSPRHGSPALHSHPAGSVSSLSSKGPAGFRDAKIVDLVGHFDLSKLTTWSKILSFVNGRDMVRVFPTRRSFDPKSKLAERCDFNINVSHPSGSGGHAGMGKFKLVVNLGLPCHPWQLQHCLPSGSPGDLQSLSISSIVFRFSRSTYTDRGITEVTERNPSGYLSNVGGPLGDHLERRTKVTFVGAEEMNAEYFGSNVWANSARGTKFSSNDIPAFLSELHKRSMYARSQPLWSHPHWKLKLESKSQYKRRVGDIVDRLESGKGPA